MIEATNVYKRFRKIFGNKNSPDFDSEFSDPDTDFNSGLKKLSDDTSKRKAYGKGREPVAAGDVIKFVTAKRGWNAQLSEAAILAAWTEIVDAQIAAKTTPLSFNKGNLLVRCESTAWATQLSFLRIDIINKIKSHFPEAQIKEIKFIGPEAPNWNHGPRTVPGRGPRDTYG